MTFGQHFYNDNDNDDYDDDELKYLAANANEITEIQNNPQLQKQIGT